MRDTSVIYVIALKWLESVGMLVGNHWMVIQDRACNQYVEENIAFKFNTTLLQNTMFVPKVHNNSLIL